MKAEIITILTAMAPTIEAHGAIVLGVGIFKFSIFKAFLLASIGTSLISIPLLIFWRVVSEFLMRRFYFINRFLNWLFSYTRRKHSDKFEKFNLDPKEKRVHLLKAFALYIFVALPGPFTGIWGGSVVAYVFGIPFKYALISLILGAFSVAAIDALIVGGVISLF